MHTLPHSTPLSNAHAYIRPYDEARAIAKATIMHGLVQVLLLARRDEATGQSAPLDEWDRKHLEAVTIRAMNCADVDLQTDIASDVVGQVCQNCQAEQIVDPRVITRRTIATLLEELGEAR